jgi:hypothetical protein
MTQWEDVADDDSPFATQDKVDGIVYATEDFSPELAFAQHTLPDAPPPLPTRPQPVRQQPVSASPWQPGPQVDPDAFAPKVRRTNPVKVFILGIIPILIAVSLVYGVIHLYGDAFTR